MADLEKTILGLECCTSAKHPISCDKCDYFGNDEYNDFWSCRISLMRDALALLKAQEPIPVNLYGKDDWYGLVCVCPECRSEWMSGTDETHFCPNCGRAVKWE